MKAWPYWVANIADAASTPRRAAPMTIRPHGIVKDTTHIAVIDKDGNVFDSTPSGAWIPTRSSSDHTGIAMSVRGESFWLDKTRAAQLRPRSRPRYTLTPSIVLRNGEPFMAIGTPGRRQSGADDPAGIPERRRVLAGVVPEPARGVRVAARPDAAFLRVVLAAPWRIQQA